MLIHHDPDEYVSKFETHRCAYHEKYPGAPYAGCTCSASSWQELRPPAEIAAIKAKRIREEEDRILAQAEVIKANRASEAIA